MSSWTPAWPRSWTRRNGSSPARTCSRARRRSSPSETRPITADDADLHGGGTRMSDVGRFGVFLPSYIWDGDGPERARGMKTFARAVEELGFDSLFITDHLFAAR